MVIKKSSVFVVGLVTFSRVALAAGIYTEGDVKASPMPSGNTWSTTNSVFVGDVSSGLVRVSTGQQWNLTSADGHASHLGELPAATGTVEINGGVWNCGQELHCGYNGIGHILIDSSGTWTVGDNAVAFGYASSASGSLDLKNGSWNSGTFGAYIGSAGRGEITVGPNGTWTSQSPVALGYAAGGSGDVTLNGGRWNVVSNTVYVGHQGSGDVKIKSGASWDAAGQEVHLGEFTNSCGIVSVSGNSIWNAGELTIAGKGAGEVVIDDGSSLNADTIFVGYSTGSSGSLTVTNGSHLMCSTSLVFGVFGSGQVDVTDGSTLETRIAWVGSWGGDGLINISGGSTWISHNTTVIGPMLGAGGAMHFVFIKDSEWKIENDVLFYGLFGNAIFLENGILSSPTRASIRMNFLDDIYGYGTVSNLTISGGNVAVGPAFDDSPGILTLQDVSFVSTNKTKLKLAVWANGSCDQLVFDDSVDFSGADIVIEFADDIAPPNGMEFTLFNYTGTGSSPLNMNNVTAPEGWALDPSGVFAEKFCKITSFAVDRAAQTAQLNFCVNPSGGDWVLQSTTNLVQPNWQDVHVMMECARSNLLSVTTSGKQCYWRVVSPDYMVIDLSGGRYASSYPVSYLGAVPPGGWTDEYKTTKLVMRRIPADSFVMGMRSTDYPGASDNGLHTVTLTKDFYIGVFEVTQRQWELVMGNKPSYFYNYTYYASRPVEQVSYNEIRENSTDSDDPLINWPANSEVNAYSFMGKLRTKTGLTTFDLPTEAQWEYACRAGTTTALNSGNNLTNQYYFDASMAEVGRYKYNTEGGATRTGTTGVGTAKVGSYLPNSWGLYDMHGNVWEWCLDWFGTYPSTAITDPVGADYYTKRVMRGGEWNAGGNMARSGNRSLDWPDLNDSSIGFRAACTLP